MKDCILRLMVRCPRISGQRVLSGTEAVIADGVPSQEAGGVFARHKVFTEENTDFIKLYLGLLKTDFCTEGVECLRMDAGHGS